MASSCYPSPVIVRFKNKFQSTAWASNFHLTSDITLTIFHFLVKDSWDPMCADFCHQHMFKQDGLNGLWNLFLCPQCQLSAAHCSTLILQYSVFNSTIVFLADIFRWMSQPGLIFKAFCLGETQLLSAWPWHMMAHLHSFGCVSSVAEHSPLSKFYNCMIADVVKIGHNVQPAFFKIYWMSQSKQAYNVNLLKNTNKKSLVRPVTFFCRKV